MVRDGATPIIQQALDAELQALQEKHASERDAWGTACFGSQRLLAVVRGVDRDRLGQYAGSPEMGQSRCGSVFPFRVVATVSEENESIGGGAFC